MPILKAVIDTSVMVSVACALEGKADYIVSRDPHLRNIKHYQRIQIVDATTFISKIKKK